MACQSAISSTFKNISQTKVKAPGVLPKVVAMVVCMACIAVASASSIMSLAWVICCRGLVCASVLSTLFPVWCILSQIALDCGFLLVVLGRQATSRSQARAKELAELRLQVLVVVITSDDCESKKEIMRLKRDLQSEGPQDVLLVLICPMTTPRLSWSCPWTIPRTYLFLLY